MKKLLIIVASFMCLTAPALSQSASAELPSPVSAGGGLVIGGVAAFRTALAIVAIVGAITLVASQSSSPTNGT